MRSIRSKEERDSSIKVHFRSRLEAVGERLESSITDSYFSLLDSLLAQRQLSDSAAIFVMDLCNVQCSGSDLIQLRRVGTVAFLSRRLVEALVSFAGKELP